MPRCHLATYVWRQHPKLITFIMTCVLIKEEVNMSFLSRRLIQTEAKPSFLFPDSLGPDAEVKETEGTGVKTVTKQPKASHHHSPLHPPNRIRRR